MSKRYLTPQETAQALVEVGKKKTALSWYNLSLLGILAGAFIAFAAQGSNVAVHNIASVGLAKTLAGILFTTGLILVVIAGAELFTGNSLIAISCLEREAKWTGLLKNWAIVYVGNFIGSLLIAYLIYKSGQLNMSGNELAGMTIKIAAYKSGLEFDSAFILGLLCNWLVCLAVWMSVAAKDIASKILAIFFPIWMFVTSGFEHSIANMYYIPAGIFAKLNPDYVQAAKDMGVSAEKIDSLNWGSMITGNLLPVTLGNIVGGVVFVALVYWVTFLVKKNKSA